ncbi:MAG: ATP-binding protein [Rhizobiaceae bacterium]|nr:ATP-binding protein [Rhizobiaceae bacterium]
MTIESLVQDPLFSLTASRSEQDWDRIEQAERAASSYITTPRDAELNDRIDGLIRRVLTRKDLNAELSRENRLKGRAEIIVGGSGAGKTRAIEKAILRQSSLRPTDGAEPTRPLLSINAPENPSPRALYMRLLNATGYPLVSVPSTEVVLQRFKSQALKLGVVIIHVDDAANLIVGQDSFRRRRAAERMAACFRGLMEDDNPISLIISGLDPVLDLVRYDEAFGRRAEVLNFYPVRENEIKSLARTIHDRAKTAGLAFAPEKEMIERLVHAASGQLGLALEMSWQAMAVATERCTSAAAPRNLESVDFAAIYHRRTACGFGLNVFETPDWRRIDTSETIPRILDDRSTQASSRRRK